MKSLLAAQADAARCGVASVRLEANRDKGRQKEGEQEDGSLCRRTERTRGCATAPRSRRRFEGRWLRLRQQSLGERRTRGAASAEAHAAWPFEEDRSKERRHSSVKGWYCVDPRAQLDSAVDRRHSRTGMRRNKAAFCVPCASSLQRRRDCWKLRQADDGSPARANAARFRRDATESLRTRKSIYGSLRQPVVRLCASVPAHWSSRS